MRARDFIFSAFRVFDRRQVDGGRRKSHWLFGKDTWGMVIAEVCVWEVVRFSGNVVVERYVDAEWQVPERHDARAPNIRCWVSDPFSVF